MPGDGRHQLLLSKRAVASQGLSGTLDDKSAKMMAHRPASLAELIARFRETAATFTA